MGQCFLSGTKLILSLQMAWALELKWTECTECWMLLVFDHYFGAECAECWVFQEKYVF